MKNLFLFVKSSLTLFILLYFLIPVQAQSTKSISFDGSDDYISIPSSAQLEVQNNFTVEA